jgi:hypothetical protein
LRETNVRPLPPPYSVRCGAGDHRRDSHACCGDAASSRLPSAGAGGRQRRNGRPRSQGEKGANGTPGTTGFTETLPSGKTLKGEWALVTSTPEKTVFEVPGDAVSFNIPLAKAPAVHYINPSAMELTATGEQKSTACLGTAAEPTATAGNLCVYAAKESVSTQRRRQRILAGMEMGVSVSDIASHGGPNTASTYGFVVQAVSLESSNAFAAGSWAVTAP